MGFYSSQILPRLIDWTLGLPFIGDLRKDCVAPARGRVLEIGFGSGLNLPFYRDDVSALTALDPEAVGWRLAQKRVKRAAFPVEFVGIGADNRLPFGSQAFDTVVTTFTLCSIPDVTQALRECLRVTKTGGKLLFLEHGRSNRDRVARWQDRLTPVQRRLAGGCHLNRAIDKLITESGWRILDLRRFSVPGPRIATSMYMGWAQK